VESTPPVLFSSLFTVQNTAFSYDQVLRPSGKYSSHYFLLLTMQRQFHLYIPFLGIARPQPQFPHSCVCERFIYSQDWSTYFLQQKRQTHRGKYNSLTDTQMWKLGLRPRYSFSGDICFKFSAFFLCSAETTSSVMLHYNINLVFYNSWLLLSKCVP
jgi:hypothetical protein